MLLNYEIDYYAFYSKTNIKRHFLGCKYLNAKECRLISIYPCEMGCVFLESFKTTTIAIDEIKECPIIRGCNYIDNVIYY